MNKFLLVILVVLFAGSANAAILCESLSGGSPYIPATLEIARTSNSCRNTSVVVTTPLTEAQSNITAAWPADRALKVEKGGSIANSTAFTVAGPFEAGLYPVFNGAGAVTLSNVAEVFPEWFGAVGDGIANDVNSIQRAIDSITYIPVVLSKDVYLCNSSLVIKTGTHLKGTSARARLDFNNVDGITAGSGVSFTRIENIEIALLVRYTTTANVLKGISYSGGSGTGCYGNIIDNVFVDGFKYGIYGNYIYNTDISRLETKAVHYGIYSEGQSIGNVVNDCILVGAKDTGSAGIHFGGTVPSEGWIITSNSVINFAYSINAAAMSHVQVIGNILDTFDVVGINLIAITTNASIGWNISNNLFGTKSSGAIAGIQIVGTDDSSQNHGHIISNNSIRAYDGGVLYRGIDTLLSATTLSTDIISGNIISGCTNRDIIAAINATITNNQCLSPVTTNVQGGKISSNNTGTQSVAEFSQRITIGSMTITYGYGAPTTGTWKQGDISWKLNAAAGGIPGYMCVTAGTPGTWKAMAVLAP